MIIENSKYLMKLAEINLNKAKTFVPLNNTKPKSNDKDLLKYY